MKASNYGTVNSLSRRGVDEPFLGIRVVSVAPGAIATPINADVLADPQRKAAVEAEIPYGRWGDVARAVAWVASDQADYVVGSTIFVDGGMTLYPCFE